MKENSNMDLKGDISNLNEVLKKDNIFEEQPIDLIANAIKSVPLHERLGIKKELLSESELKTFEDESKKASKCFRDKMKSLCMSRKLEDLSIEPDLPSDEQCHYEKSIELPVSGVREKEERNKNDIIFLKHLYNCDENDHLISTLINNVDFNISIESDEVPKSLDETDKPFNPAALLNDISCGKWDDMLTSYQTYKPSSSSESEEEMSTEVLRYSNEFKSTLNASTKPSKFPFFEVIKEDSLRVNGPEEFNPANWVSSETESEEELGEVLTPQEPIIHQHNPESTKKEISSAHRNSKTKYAKKKVYKNKHLVKAEGDKITYSKREVANYNNRSRPEKNPDQDQGGEPQSRSLDQGIRMDRSHPTKNVKKLDDSGNRSKHDSTAYKSSQFASQDHVKTPINVKNTTNKPGASIEKSNYETLNVTSPKNSSNNTNKPGASNEKSNHETLNVTSPKDSSNNTNKPGASNEKSKHETLNVTSPKDRSNNLVSAKVIGKVSATKKTVNDSASDSSDEDWASLAEKNLCVVDKLLQNKK